MLISLYFECLKTSQINHKTCRHVCLRLGTLHVLPLHNLVHVRAIQCEAGGFEMAVLHHSSGSHKMKLNIYLSLEGIAGYS